MSISCDKRIFHNNKLFDYKSSIDMVTSTIARTLPPSSVNDFSSNQKICNKNFDCLKTSNQVISNRPSLSDEFGTQTPNVKLPKHSRCAQKLTSEITHLQPPTNQQKQSSGKNRTSVGRSQSHITSRPVGKYSNNRNFYNASVTEKNENSVQLTLVLMGAPMVGKSSLVNQFLWEKFSRDYRPTVEEFNWIEYESDKTIDIKRRSDFGSNSSVESVESSLDEKFNCTNRSTLNQRILLQIIDSAGSRDFLAMRYLYYKMGNAFIIVYSINDPLSYTEALLLIREIQQRNLKNAPILLVANKIDIEDENAKVECNFKSRPEILSTFPNPENIDFIRLSAKNLSQVKQAFNRLINELSRKREIGGKSLHRLKLQKRRQSMPSRRTADELGIDAVTLERLVRIQNNSHSRHSNCLIS